jgi:hypothetical protein
LSCDRDVFSSLGRLAWEGMDQAEAAKMFAQIDADGDSSVCVAELVRFFKERDGPRKQPDYQVRNDVARKGFAASLPNERLPSQRTPPFPTNESHTVTTQHAPTTTRRPSARQSRPPSARRRRRRPRRPRRA